MERDVIPNPRTLKIRARIGAALGILWSLIVFGLFYGKIDDGDRFAERLSGMVTAIYAPIIFSARGPGPSRTVGCIALVAVGMTHIFWLWAMILSCADLVAALIPWPGSVNTISCLLTAIGYAVTIALCTKSWRALCIMLGSGVLVVLIETPPLCWYLGPWPIRYGIAISLLHLGIVASLYFTARTAIDAYRRSGLCKACGYDLAGLRDGVCPECGQRVGLGAIVERTQPASMP